METLSSRSTALQRKNSLKRRPSIRQTKGSIIRMLNANPLLQFDEEAKKELGITETLLRQYGLTNFLPKSSDPSFYNSDSKHNPSTSTTNLASTSSQCDIQKEPTNTSKFSKNTQRNSAMIKQSKSSNLHSSKPSVSVSNPKSVSNKPSNAASNRATLSTMHRKSVLYGKSMTAKRRSVSAERFDTKQHLGVPSKHNVSLTQSLEDIHSEALIDLQISPILQESNIFKTPKANHRRSVYAIPSTGKKNLPSFYSSTPGKSDLKSRLNQWLAKRGKSIGSFHHLKCFGIQKPADPVLVPPPIDEENKENIELEGNLRRDPSYESLGIIHEEQECKDSTGSVNESNRVDIDYESIARDALHDLYKLIQDGYPHEQCAAWLKIVNDKCKNLEEEPHYWECRAALEQCGDNIINAVECYRTAIIKGAEVASVDQSLDQLLKKFSLLNIAPTGNETNEKAKVIMEARNVFKSSIIQFAVQERDMRKKDKDKNKCLYVTPVRRSSRLSMHTKATPGVKLCSSLKDVDVSFADKVQFKKNEFLSVRYN